MDITQFFEDVNKHGLMGAIDMRRRGMTDHFQEKTVGPEVIDALEKVLTPGQLEHMKDLAEAINDHGNPDSNGEMSQSTFAQELRNIARKNDSPNMTNDMRAMLREEADNLWAAAPE